MADLGRWLSGDYRVPADPGAEDELPERDDESEEPGRWQP
jgi:endogenous inhibitor of DNA gyrase (YacG/DUF329 family)